MTGTVLLTSAEADVEARAETDRMAMGGDE